MAQTAEQISNHIKAQYPTLEERYTSMAKAEGISVSFEQLKEQLAWSINAIETARAIHRVHCITELYLTKSDSELYNVLHLAEPHQRSALIALTVLDATKACKEASTAYTSATGNPPLKDSVPAFFDMLHSCPEQYPLFKALGKPGQEYIQKNIFYIHLRHLQFGEVPTSSLNAFKETLNEAQEIARQKLQLMSAFWLANLLGFEKISDGTRGEEQFSTASKERVAEFFRVDETLKKCISEKSLEPMQNFYETTLASSQVDFKESSVNEKALLGRLYALLNDRYGRETMPEIFAKIAKHKGLMQKISELAVLEEQQFSTFKLQAITFLPAVYWKLDEIMDKAPIEDKLMRYVQLQIQLLQSVPTFMDTLDRDRSIPLFSIKENKDGFLEKLIRSPENVEFKLSVNSPFLTVSGTLKPVLSAAIVKGGPTLYTDGKSEDPSTQAKHKPELNT